MAFSSRFGRAAPKDGGVPAGGRASAEDSDEVESVDGEDAADRQRQLDKAKEEDRLRKLKEEQLKVQEAALRRRQAAEDESGRQREAADEARRRAEQDEARRRAYEDEKARLSTIERSKREAARRATGGAAGFGGGGGGVSGFGPGGGGGQTFAWKKGQDEQGGLSFGQSAGGAQPAPARPGPKTGSAAYADMPSHDDCELGISAMISRSHNGMKEGLSLLGLPHFPLVFVPGQELRLCGHNVREEVNEMIHAWMTDEKDDFHEVLLRIKTVVSKPILTEEEMEMMDKQDQWEKVVGADGKAIFKKRDDAADDDDDDEVIDVPSASARPLAAASAARAVEATPARAPAAAAAPGEEDYYTLLGADQSASLHEIRTKFRALVVTEHPEKGGDPKKFQKLNKAYSVLSDQKKRQEYDESVGLGGGGAGAARAKRFVD